MADTKQDLMRFLSSCAEEIEEVVLIIRTVNGVAFISSVDEPSAKALIEEGGNLRERSGFNRNACKNS